MPTMSNTQKGRIALKKIKVYFKHYYKVGKIIKMYTVSLCYCYMLAQ